MKQKVQESFLVRIKKFFALLFDNLDKKMEIKAKSSSCCCKPTEGKNKSCCNP